MIKSPEEVIGIPLVKCSLCGNPCTKGLHQIRLIPIKNAERVKEYGEWVLKPPVMKRVDFYMCISCVEKEEKWPGKRP